MIRLGFTPRNTITRFWRNWRFHFIRHCWTIFQSSCMILLLHCKYVRSGCPTSSKTLTIARLLILAILVDMKHVCVVLVFIMTNYIGQCFICSMNYSCIFWWSVCSHLSSLEKHERWPVRVFYTWWVQILGQMHIAWSGFQPVACLFFLLTVYLNVQKFWWKTKYQPFPLWLKLLYFLCLFQGRESTPFFKAL